MTDFVVCVRHRFLWWLPGKRWHAHMHKPVDLVGSVDYEFIEATRETLGRWWVVEVLGQQR